MESFFHETCFSNEDNRVLDVLRTSVKHRPKRSGDGTSGSTLRLRDEKEPLGLYVPRALFISCG